MVCDGNAQTAANRRKKESQAAHVSLLSYLPSARARGEESNAHGDPRPEALAEDRLWFFGFMSGWIEDRGTRMTIG
jgi:hypothetical protein